MIHLAIEVTGAERSSVSTVFCNHCNLSGEVMGMEKKMCEEGIKTVARSFYVSKS